MNRSVSIPNNPQNADGMYNSRRHSDVTRMSRRQESRYNDCLFNSLFNYTKRKTSQVRVIGPMWRGSTGHKGPITWIPCPSFWDVLCPWKKATQIQRLDYSISQEICTRFCCALLCSGYAIVHNEFTWSIYPYSSGLLCCEVSLMDMGKSVNV